MNNEKRARALVALRSDGDCEAGITGVCHGAATTMHHRRKPGRVWSASNLLHLCGSGTTGCHGWIEAHPALSHEYGWWIFTGDGEPNTVAVYLHAHTEPKWVLLDNRGGCK